MNAMPSPVPGDHPGIDTSKPNTARTYDFLLGGKDYFPADMELARKLLEITPQLPEMLRDNRAFIERVVMWAASQGITQFLDLGAGLPTNRPVHRIAREVIPDAHVIYADLDELVVGHATTLLATDDGVAAVKADLTDPAAVLSDTHLLAVIDTEKPVCALLALTLHFQSADAARGIVAEYARLLAAGSVIAVSVIRNDSDASWRKARSAYTAGELHNHAPLVVASFLAATEMVAPGVTLAHAWRGEMPDTVASPANPAYVLSAVGRVRG
jgi:SAM-dependent methyltransferase